MKLKFSWENLAVFQKLIRYFWVKNKISGYSCFQRFWRLFDFDRFLTIFENWEIFDDSSGISSFSRFSTKIRVHQINRFKPPFFNEFRTYFEAYFDRFKPPFWTISEVILRLISIDLSIKLSKRVLAKIRVHPCCCRGKNVKNFINRNYT